MSLAMLTKNFKKLTDNSKRSEKNAIKAIPLSTLNHSNTKKQN